MLYMQTHTGRGDERAFIFSDTDSFRELDAFRCFVRAPKMAMYAVDRPHLVLIGKPRLHAITAMTRAMQFPTPIERMAWERQQDHIMKRNPVLFEGA